MFKLLNEKDKDVLNKNSFAKNALFYKDMLAFCNAYEEITTSNEELPNFCYNYDKKFCLEGICLLIKMYATEFKFETLKLTLDYLKILYFAVANYSDNGVDVDTEIIKKEFELYRSASIEYCDKSKEMLDKKLDEVNKKKQEINEIKNKSKNKRALKNVFNTLYIFMFIFSVFALVVPALMAYYHKASHLVVGLTAGGILVVGIGLAILFKHISKKFASVADYLLYESQVKEKENSKFYEEYVAEMEKYDRILCEKYEYNSYFLEVFSKYTKVLSIYQILKKAKEYKLISYNIVSDIKRLFIEQQNEVNEVISDIENIRNNEAYQNRFADVYKKIKDEDYFYYNGEIRFHFLRKFSDICEKEHVWKLQTINGEINPFDVDVRRLSREKVAFVKDENSEIISASLNDFLGSKYAKSLEELNFSGNYNLASLKRLKSSYYKHFYNHDFLNEYFEGKKNVTVLDKEIRKACVPKIPTYILLKLRLLENINGFENSGTSTIKQMAGNIFGDDATKDSDLKIVFSEVDVEYPKTDCEYAEDLGDRIKYVSGKKEIIGYKIV